MGKIIWEQSVSRKVISRKNIPSYPPFALTGVLYLLLDKLQVSMLWWGIFGTLVVLMWLAWVIVIWQEDEIDIFKDNQ